MNIDTTLGIVLIALAAAILIGAAIILAIGYYARLGAEVERMDSNDRDGVDFDTLRRRIGDPVIPQPTPEIRGYQPLPIGFQPKAPPKAP